MERERIMPQRLRPLSYSRLPFCRDDGIVVVVNMRSDDIVAAAPRLMTVDQYFRTPETLKPMELIFGAVRAAAAPTPFHQSAVLQFCLALVGHVRERGLGRVWVAPLDVVLDERDALI